MYRRSWTCWIAVVIVLLAIGISGAASADQLTVQTWGGVWEKGARAVGDRFATKYGVDVRYEQQQNTRMGIAKIKAQASDPQIDILFSTADAMQQAADEGLLAPVNPSLAPSFAGLPEKAVHDKYVDIMNILFGFVYRKDLVPFAPSKWNDLLDPRLKRLVASPNAMFAGGRWLIMASLINGGNSADHEAGAPMTKLLQQIHAAAGGYRQFTVASAQSGPIDRVGLSGRLSEEGHCTAVPVLTCFAPD